ncbi:SLC13 family permease [Pseudonocardia acaciae]|uniref:SLC13 family permease n=1 Tax=Pseudonocardia acaciae TaxID=551276 RepID=UPI00048DD281|nr:SLC13 family permease [Pseudonocardia acaciae]
MGHTVGLAVLAAVFLLGTIRPINMGALALGAAFVVGLTVYGSNADDIAAGFPASMLIVLVGVTYLFALATRNGTVDWLVDAAVRMVQGRIGLIPWVMFLVPCALTSIGSATPSAVAVMVPIALKFARQYRISEAMTGVMVIQGATAGGFSPLGIYGIVVNGLVGRVPPLALFAGTFTACLLVAGVAYVRYSGFAPRVPDPEPAGGGGAGGGGATRTVVKPAQRLTPRMVLTLCGILTLVLGALLAGLDVGFAAITVVAVLGLVHPEDGKAAAGDIAWGTVLLICGIITYIALLQRMGAIDWLGARIAGINAPLLAALFVCVIGAVVSAFASTTAFLGAVLPMAAPFLGGGEVGTVGLVVAVAVSTSVVDCSPYSTMGALTVANAGESTRDGVFRSLMRWGLTLMLVAPVLAWGLLVLPGSW